VPRKNLVVDWEIAVRDGTVPNLVIVSALAVKKHPFARRIRFTE
jgi:hypothetical protein